jgi:hypothetical protein
MLCIFWILPNINFFATAREQLELFVEASHSSRNSSLLKILSTQMVPTGKNWECKFRGLWWSCHWCPPSNPVLSELFIWPCFDGIVVPNLWDSITQRRAHFLSCEYKWGVRIGCNIRLLIHKLSVIHFTWGEIQFPFFCTSKRSMLGWLWDVKPVHYNIYWSRKLKKLQHNLR